MALIFNPTGSTHRLLAWGATTVAFTAYAGAVSLADGALSLGPELEHRLPLHSPVLGGAALALLVGLPFTAVAVAAFRRSDHTGEAAVGAALMLLGWIGVQIAFIRTLSVLQGVYVVVAVAFLVAGHQIGAGRLTFWSRHGADHKVDADVEHGRGPLSRA